jgi:hypothetical protein
LEKEILYENSTAEIQACSLQYILGNQYNEFKGTYVYKELLTIICIKASVKYLRIVGKIMDSINDRKFEILNKDHQNTKPKNISSIIILGY